MPSATTTPYTDAIDELANEHARRPIRDAISARDALPHATPAVVIAWFRRELGRQSGPGFLGEILAERLTEAESAEFVSSAVSAHKAELGAMVERILCQRAAEDLAFDAERAADNLEPTDEEASRPCRDHGDLVREEQTSMARFVNAGLRVAGLVQP